MNIGASNNVSSLFGVIPGTLRVTDKYVDI